MAINFKAEDSELRNGEKKAEMGRSLNLVKSETNTLFLKTVDIYIQRSLVNN